MPSVNAVKLCPKCSEVLPNPTPEKCKNCKTVLTNTSNEFFERNFPFSLQLDEHRSSCFKEIDQKTPPSEDEEKKWVEIQKAWIDWLRNVNYEEKLYALRDAHYLLKQLLFSNSSREEIKALITVAKDIGKIAEGIDKYYQSGGEFYANEVRQVQAYVGDDARDPEAID